MVIATVRRRLGTWVAAIMPCILGLAACGGSGSTGSSAGNGNNSTSDTDSPIKHVIIVVGENRSFDHLFATYLPRFPGHRAPQPARRRSNSPLAADCDICNPFEYEVNSPAMIAGHMRDVTDPFTDLANGTLPAVSYVKPSHVYSEHSSRHVPLSLTLDSARPSRAATRWR